MPRRLNHAFAPAHAKPITRRFLLGVVCTMVLPLLVCASLVHHSMLSTSSAPPLYGPGGAWLNVRLRQIIMSYPSLAGGGGADTCVRKVRNMHVHDAYLTPHLCAALTGPGMPSYQSVDAGPWIADR